MSDLSAIPESWRAALAPVLAAPEARHLGGRLKAEAAAGATIYPPQGVRLAALALTPLPAVKVVILGQDPYHGPGQAHGLAFSVQDGVRVPPSLVNIYKELQSDLGIPPARTGNLTRWAEQGVLLLNNALTVVAGQAGSHQNIGWEAITDAVVAAVAADGQPCVFMLWGSHAQKKAARVPALARDAQKRAPVLGEESRANGNAAPHHLVLTAPHPSPLSAHKGWFGTRHFSRANAFLQEHGRMPIDWRLEP